MRRTGAELLVVGGHEETVAELLPFLPHRLQDKVAGTFVVDPSTMTPGQVRQRADQVAEASSTQGTRRRIGHLQEGVLGWKRELGRLLVAPGAMLVLLGLVVWLGGRLGLGRLPGDISVSRGNFHFYAPLGTCLLLSAVLTLVLNVASRR